MTRWTALGALCLLFVLPCGAHAQSSPPAASPPAATSNKASGAGVAREEYILDAKARAAKLANRRFDAIDTAHKGVVTRDEFVKYYEDRSAQFASRRFDLIDTDHNGVIEQSELDAWKAAHQRTRSTSAGSPSTK